MKLRITQKLFIALILTIALVVIAMVLLMQWSLDRGFLKYVNQTESRQLDKLALKLTNYYSGYRNWHFLRDDDRTWRQIVSSRNGRAYRPANDQYEGFHPHPRAHQPPPSRPFDIGPRLSLLDTDKKYVAGRRNAPPDAMLYELTLEGQTVGWLRLAPMRKLRHQRDLQFVEQQSQAFYIIALIVILTAAAASIMIARQFLSPIRRLASATRSIRNGDLDVRLAATANDELGELTEDFNRLAKTLGEAESMRRQWVVDIAHELRTPLAILRGEIEALQDGVRQWNDTAGASLHSEVVRLGKLVDDLYQLSLSDIGRLRYDKTQVDLISLLHGLVDTFSMSVKRKNIRMSTQWPADKNLFATADRDRMIQLFTNLLENSLRYTNASGAIELQLSHDADHAIVEIHDSEPAVPDAALAKLFDRLFRVEESRNRASGGAGIGLAMCQRIVFDHGGRINASHSPLGGLAITVLIPIIGPREKTTPG